MCYDMEDKPFTLPSKNVTTMTKQCEAEKFANHYFKNF